MALAAYMWVVYTYLEQWNNFSTFKQQKALR